MTKRTMTIYEKLAYAREEFHGMKLVKTGKNKFAGYSYFELGDFLIPAMDCLRHNGLIAVVTFAEEMAALTLFEFEGGASIQLTSPMRDAALKGCHPIQNLGAVETYQRRYLWVGLMEIVEHDALDSAAPLKEEPKTATPKKKVAKKKATKKAAPEVDPTPNVFGVGDQQCEVKNAEGAAEVVDLIITLADMHKNSVENLISFWQNNANVIGYLGENYPDEFTRLKRNFSEIKSSITGASS